MACALHAQQRIGTTLPVDGGTTGDLKAQPCIEAERLSVLLIHIYRQHLMRSHGALHQQLANALAPSIGANEKGFKMGVAKEHEANRNILAVYGHLEVRGGKKGADFRLDGLAVLGIEKIVSGIDSASPDLHKAISVYGAAGAHGEAYRLQMAGFRDGVRIIGANPD